MTYRDPPPLAREELHDTNALLAETIFAAQELGDVLCQDDAPAPQDTQCQLAICPQNFREACLKLPDSLSSLDVEALSQVVVTYAFGAPESRPHLDIRLETDSHVLATISRPGLEAERPYEYVATMNGNEYMDVIPADEVADLLDQIVVPSCINKGVAVADPQFPPEARNIIDTLAQSQHAISVESRRFALATTETKDYHPTSFNVTMYTINREVQEIEIELMLDDRLYMDSSTGELHQYSRSIIGAFALDSCEDLSQAVAFTLTDHGEIPSAIEPNTELLQLFQLELANLCGVLRGPEPTPYNLDPEEIADDDFRVTPK